MGAKRSDMPAKGTTTLASMYSKRANTNPQKHLILKLLMLLRTALMPQDLAILY
jgi:hypothetical protein